MNTQLPQTHRISREWITIMEMTKVEREVVGGHKTKHCHKSPERHHTDLLMFNGQQLPILAISDITVKPY